MVISHYRINIFKKVGNAKILLRLITFFLSAVAKPNFDISTIRLYIEMMLKQVAKNLGRRDKPQLETTTRWA